MRPKKLAKAMFVRIRCVGLEACPAQDMEACTKRRQVFPRTPIPVWARKSSLRIKSPKVIFKGMSSEGPEGCGVRIQ